MLFWTLQITIISIILIFLVHHLIIFFKSTLTIPKVKDLVNTTDKKYENMFSIINHNNTNNYNDSTTKIIDISELIPQSESQNQSYIQIPDSSQENMKNELKNFLKSQLNNSVNPEPYFEQTYESYGK